MYARIKQVLQWTWKWNFPTFRKLWQKLWQTNGPTNVRTDRLIGKFHFQYFSYDNNLWQKGPSASVQHSIYSLYSSSYVALTLVVASKLLLRTLHRDYIYASYSHSLYMWRICFCSLSKHILVYIHIWIYLLGRMCVLRREEWDMYALLYIIPICHIHTFHIVK